MRRGTDRTAGLRVKARLPLRARRIRAAVTGVAVSGAAALALLVPASASATFTYLGAFSGGRLDNPEAIAIAPNTTGAAQAVYVAEDTTDNGDDVLKFSPSGGSMSTFIQQVFTCPGPTNGGFDGPQGLAVDPATGDVYVSATGDNRVIEFNSSGVFIAGLGGGAVSTTCSQSAATAGSAPGEFNQPTGLAVGDGELFVAQPGVTGGTDQYVDEIPLGFTQLRTTELNTPADDYGDAAVDPRTGNIYATDSAYNGIDEFNAAGKLLDQSQRLFDGGNFSGTNPQWVAVDPVAGVVYANDSLAGRVYTFDATTGVFLQALTGIDTPAGLAVDPVNHILYVASDGSHDTVERYSYTPAPSCVGSAASVLPGSGTALALSCTDKANATVTYAIASHPAHGALSAFDPTTGRVTYTPAAGYDGPDSFSFTGMSVNGTSQPATFSIEIGPAPTCASETLSTAAAAALALTLSCSGNAGAAAVSYRVVTNPSHGSLSAPSSAGALTYAPSAGFAGSDSFTYEGVSSAGTASAPQTVTIYVADALPPPVAGQSANVLHALGLVYVTLPGQTQAIPLVAGMQIPLGSIIDATGGRVEVLVSTGHGVQHADFYEGEFRLTQSTNTHSRRLVVAKAGGLYAVLDLLGATIPKPRCTSNPRSVSGAFSLTQAHIGRSLVPLRAKFHEKGKPLRQLWGSGHGNYTTVGNGSSSSVRGTRWAIFDYPDGTLTRVFTDSVAVYDFHTRRTVTVHAGHYFFAALGNVKRCR